MLISSAHGGDGGARACVALTIANQATLAYDADANGTNETSTLSDDVAGGSLDATTFPVVALPLGPTEPTEPTEPAAPPPGVAESTFTG